jgi:hypothetical protein
MGITAAAAAISGAGALANAASIGSSGQSAAAAANPFASQYPQYQNALQQLEFGGPANLALTPGYQAGLQAIQRSSAAEGFSGSGNTQVALLNYGGNIYAQQEAILAQLSGANSQNTGAAANAITQSSIAQANLTGQGLNSLAYGGSALLKQGGALNPGTSSSGLANNQTNSSSSNITYDDSGGAGDGSDAAAAASSGSVDSYGF